MLDPDECQKQGMVEVGKIKIPSHGAEHPQELHDKSKKVLISPFAIFKKKTMNLTIDPLPLGIYAQILREVRI